MPDATAIQGTWQVAKAELAGEEMPPFVAEKMTVELGDGVYVVRFADEISDRGTFTLETNGALKSIRLCGVEGVNAGRTIPAIYQLVGDRLRVCYGLDGIPPTAFATTAGEKFYLATYRRDRPV